MVQKIGNTAAKELMLTGRRFSAEEAKAFHLVNVVVSEAEMIDTERQYIEHFMHASPDAIAECKNLLRMVTCTDDRFNPIFMQTSYRRPLQPHFYADLNGHRQPTHLQGWPRRHGGVF